MIRCRQCNSELTEQARYCNVCGLPQNPQELELENSTHNRAETLDTNSSDHCVHCGAEIPNEARFCAVCGTAHSPKKEAVIEISSIKPSADVSKTTKQEDLTVRLQPSVAVKPAQHGQTVQEQLSRASEKASIRPKTITRSPVFPSRPTNNGMKPAATVKEADNTAPELAPGSPVAPSQTMQPNQEKAAEQSVQTGVPKNIDADSNILQSTRANQIADEAASLTRTPGLIRPITPKSSTRSVIPSRPEGNGQASSNSQPAQTSPTPENPISAPPATILSPVNKQTQKPSSSFLMETKAERLDKQQIAQQATQGGQNYYQTRIDPNRIQNRSQQQTVSNRATTDKTSWRDSTLFELDELSSRNRSLEHDNGKNAISDSPTIDLLNPASFMATSKAAEQWRKSWRDRQYAEAGPAQTVSRGQASVPSPLTSMQQSFLRMRAMQKNDKKQPGKRSVNLGTWIIIFLMICLIIGLGAYISISYIPSSPFGTSVVPSSNNSAQPTLVLIGTTTQTITIGHPIQLHGTQFGGNQAIIFLRDTATPIIDSRGKNISTRTDSLGTFDVTIPIDNSWSVGSHSIEALDKSSNQHAFLTIQTIPTGTATTSSTDLSVTIQGKPATRLNFTSVIGQGNPAPQQITITNMSGSPLQWTATAAANNNLNWLQINDNNNYGQLAISQPHNMLISVNTTGLKTTDKNHPYLGQIIFTINNAQLLTLPVQLHIVDATPEMVFSPNPIIAPIGPGNTCQTGVTLTLINLGSAAISWAVNPDLTNKIKFVQNGQLLESGTLLPSGSFLPSGQPGDIVVLTLQCNNIQAGQQYTVRVYANQSSWSDPVIIHK